ncbi:MAG: hypothetical protein ACI9UJ_000235 [bacterium]|jgi:hypothetical protein
MPKKNSIGAILFAVGLFLSASLYATLWFISSNSLFENITIALHDTYITLHPFFILAGIFTVGFNLFLIVVQFFKRLKVITWNIAHAVSLLLFGGFLFYGREVLRFGFAFLGRRLDHPDQTWSANPQIEGITYTIGTWEKCSQHLPEIFLSVICLTVVLLIVLTVKNRKQKPYKSTV